MLNVRPTFLHGGHILTPHSIDSALMKRSSSHIRVFTLSDFIIPKDKTMRQLIHELTLESKEVLNLIVGETAAILLNKKVHQEKFDPNELCFIPDLLYAKNPNSLIDSLARVRETKDSTTYALTLLNKKIIM